MPVDHVMIGDGPVRLASLDADLARSIRAGDVGGLTAGDGWPTEHTEGATYMVAVKGAEGWLVTVDGAVVGDVVVVDDDGDVLFGFALAEPYRQWDGDVRAALAADLAGRPGTRRVTEKPRPAADARPPRIAAGERDTLLAFIDYLRACLIGKLDGLSEVDARRSTVPSGTSLLGLLKHVVEAEHSFVHWTFAGGPESEIPSGILSAADTVASVAAAARATGARTGEILRGCDDLDTPAAEQYSDDHVMTLRWILVHLVEEFGRHAGHADIIREQIDGATGR